MTLKRDHRAGSARRLRRPLCALLLASAAACADRSEPLEPQTSIGTVQTPNDTQVASNTAAMLGDARERLIPALPAGAERDALEAAVLSVTKDLETGNTAAAQTGIAALQATLAGEFSDNRSGAAADLDALRLTLTAIEAELALTTTKSLDH